MSHRITAKITGVAGYVPPKVLTNADLEKMVATNDEWIRTRTGIRERRIAADVLRRAQTGGGEATDCAGLVEAAGGRIKVVEGDPRLLKVTSEADLETVAGWR